MVVVIQLSLWLPHTLIDYDLSLANIIYLFKKLIPKSMFYYELKNRYIPTEQFLAGS